jgi:hypothetical protein
VAERLHPRPEGRALEDIALLAYSTKYSGGGGSGAAPYIIVVTEAGNHVASTPNTQSSVTPREDAFRRWVVMHGTVRYNEDSAGTERTWAQLVAEHAYEQVDYVTVQAGNAGADSAGSTSHVRNVSTEGTVAAATFASYTFAS